ncbi:MAG: hypothetical protein V4620_01845 [Bacteroidota bacterium]
MDADSNFDEELRLAFNSDARFISHYLSKQVRKIKYSTNGSFNMVSVSPSKDILYKHRIVGENALQIRIPFETVLYKNMLSKERFNYYLKLLEEGYQLGNKYKTLPIDELVNLNNNLKNNGFINKWLHKRKIFKEYNLCVSLTAEFSAVDFQLHIQVETIKEKSNLVSGLIFKTAPYEAAFSPLFKDLVIENENLIITEYLDRPKVVFTLENILNKRLIFQILDNGLKYEPYQVLSEGNNET